MPQLNEYWYISQVFWLFIIFTGLYLVMARLSLPKIRDILQNRQSKIAGDLEKAKAMKEEAEIARAEYTVGLEGAKEKARNLLQEATDSINKVSADRHRELDKMFEKQIAEADQRINILNTEMKTQMESVSKDVAEAMIEVLAGEISIKKNKAGAA